MTIITDNLNEQLCIFMITTGSILLKIRNVSDIYVDKLTSHILCSVPLFMKSYIFWNNMEKYDSALQVTNNIIIRTGIICRITEDINKITICNNFVLRSNHFYTKSQLYVTSKQSLCLWNEQENVLARLYASGETQQVRTATQSWNVWSDAAKLI